MLVFHLNALITQIHKQLIHICTYSRIQNTSDTHTHEKIFKCVDSNVPQSKLRECERGREQKQQKWAKCHEVYANSIWVVYISIKTIPYRKKRDT